MINTLGFLSRKDIRHVSLVLSASSRLDVLGSRGVLKLVGNVHVLRFRLARERHVDLVIALRGARFVLVHGRVHVLMRFDALVVGIFLKIWPYIYTSCSSTLFKLCCFKTL